MIGLFLIQSVEGSCTTQINLTSCEVITFIKII